MKRTILLEGKTTTIGELPAGSFFKRNETIGFKTEYRRDDGSCECYCIESGEAFWGGVTGHRVNDLVVIEMELIDLDVIEEKNNIPYVPFPIAFHTVDVIAIRRDELDAPEDIQILLGRKPGQTQWQFVGGFVEPTHTAEHTAAKEFHEEAGLLIEEEDRFKYLTSMHIKDERYLASPHQITSSIFFINLSVKESSQLKAGDDLEQIMWVNVNAAYDLIRPQHKEIFVKFLINRLSNK
jgi:8-oxo-dGTP pyrophosphatase MutT (NUDIX family)